MSIPRRRFLRDATLSVGLLLASSRFGFAQGTGQVRQPSGNPLDVPLEAQKDPVFRFAESTFQPYLGGIFQAPNARGEMIELRLVKIQKHEPTNRITKLARRSESFSLMFQASGELPPFTSIHTVSHPALGEFDLFLTRRKSDKDELFYEAVINHVR